LSNTILFASYFVLRTGRLLLLALRPLGIVDNETKKVKK
jgi:hypothetical protein